MVVTEISQVRNGNRCYQCCIFRPEFGCCAPQMLVKIVILGIFSAKKLKECKKVTNLVQNLAKNVFFWVCTKTLVDCFIPKISSSFLVFMDKKLFSKKKPKNDYFDYFDWHLGCAVSYLSIWIDSKLACMDS